jgi:hypothetical protein
MTQPDPVEVYKLMELIWPSVISLRPLENPNHMDKFEQLENSAKRILKAGYHK